MAYIVHLNLYAA